MIEINNLTTNRIDENLLKKIAEEVLREEEKKETDLSIVLIGQRRIKELNKKYRRKNRSTDVLSFLYNGLGEVAICLREVKKNAKRFALDYEKELVRVLIHGILHLLGYDHEGSEEGAEKMEKKEKYYFSKIG